LLAAGTAINRESAPIFAKHAGAVYWPFVALTLRSFLAGANESLRPPGCRNPVAPGSKRRNGRSSRPAPDDRRHP